LDAVGFNVPKASLDVVGLMLSLDAVGLVLSNPCVGLRVPVLITLEVVGLTVPLLAVGFMLSNPSVGFKVLVGLMVTTVREIVGLPVRMLLGFSVRLLEKGVFVGCFVIMVG